MWKEEATTLFCICLERLRKSTKDFNQDDESLGWYLNLGPPLYEIGVLMTLL
jgi:hypothetical protein